MKAGSTVDIRRRHSKRQQKRRRQQLIRRTITISTLSVILLSVILFATPLLNIRDVNISGNIKVTSEELQPVAEALYGRNLLLTGKKGVKKMLLSFPYTDDISVNKNLFPPSLIIEIEEREPAIYLMHNQEFVIVDETGRILEVTNSKPEIPELTGLKLTSSNQGETLSLDDNSRLKTVISILEDFKKSGLLTGITKISFEDMDNIVFNYENRIDGICGPYVDFKRKLGLFREAITSNQLTEKSRGTIDLTKTGHAVYRP